MGAHFLGQVKAPLAELPVKGELTSDDLEIIRKKLEGLGYLE